MLFLISKEGHVLVKKEHSDKTAIQFRTEADLETFFEKIKFNCFISEDRIIQIRAFETVEIDIRAYLIEIESDVTDESYSWIDTEPIIITDQENTFSIDILAFIQEKEFYIVQRNQKTNEKTNISKEQFCEYLSLHSKGNLRLNKPIKNHFTPKTPKTGERSGK